MRSNQSESNNRDAALFLSVAFNPRLRILLALLGRDDVQRELVKVGALRRVGGA
jgi:hypothetical protein